MSPQVALAFAVVILTVATSTTIFIWRSRRHADAPGGAAAPGRASVVVRIALVVALVLIVAALVGFVVLVLGT